MPVVVGSALATRINAVLVLVCSFCCKNAAALSCTSPRLSTFIVPMLIVTVKLRSTVEGP
jgi:hypothetical protein